MDEGLPAFTSPDVHHHMSVSTKDYCDISCWIAGHSEDPAYVVSLFLSQTMNL